MRLRPYKSSDARFIMNWFSDERRFTMWSAGKLSWPLDEQQLAAHEQRWRQEQAGWIFTALDDQGRPVGHLLMRKADYIKNSIHFGLIVVDPAVRGKGYGKEMLRLAGKYAFEILGVSRITLGVFGENGSARHCYQSVGFQDENLVKHDFQFQNEWWDLYEMAWEHDRQ